MTSRILALGLAGLLAPGAAAADWTLQEVPLEGDVAEIRQDEEAVFVRNGGWQRVAICEDGRVCLTAGEPFLPEPAPEGAAGWTIAEAEGSGIRRAWYAEPTDRYPHGVFGEPVSAGALVVEDASGRRVTLRLPADSVFEDLSPYVADFDGDGQNNVLAVRSSLRAGSQLVVYRFAGGTLIESASTSPLGRPNRWLSVAGIADFTGNGRMDIAIVKTPHEDGTLEVLTVDRRQFRPVGRPLAGFSNHVFGSLEPSISAVARINRDRIADLVVPGADRRSLRMLTAAGGSVREIGRVELDGTVVTGIGVIERAGGTVLICGLDDGRLVAVLVEE